MADSEEQETVKVCFSSNQDAISIEVGVRMVKCWNACRGVPDPEAAVKAAREALKDAKAYIQAIEPETECNGIDAALALLNGEQP